MFRSTAGGGLREGTIDTPSSSLLVVIGVAVPSYTCIHTRMYGLISRLLGQ